MSATVTVTGTVGPGKSLTSAVFTDVSSFTIDCATNMLTIIVNAVTKQISINAATTITATKSASVYTLTIS
jgi:RNase adaptor protein for sRNA GlmZ degradation